MNITLAKVFTSSYRKIVQSIGKLWLWQNVFYWTHYYLGYIFESCFKEFCMDWLREGRGHFFKQFQMVAINYTVAQFIITSWGTASSFASAKITLPLEHCFQPGYANICRCKKPHCVCEKPSVGREGNWDDGCSLENFPFSRLNSHKKAERHSSLWKMFCNTGSKTTGQQLQQSPKLKLPYLQQ